MLIEALDHIHTATDTHAAALGADAFGAPLDDAPLDEEQLDADDASDEQEVFVTQLLSALAAMAIRSKRRQADLSAALQRSGLKATPSALMAALAELETRGCIEDLVPLYDGGVLMSVTTRGIEHLSAGPRWTMLDGPGFRMA